MRCRFFYLAGPEQRTRRVLLELKTISEIAAFLRLKKSTVYHLVSRKEIPHIKIGGRLLFDKIMVEEWLSSKVVVK